MANVEMNEVQRGSFVDNPTSQSANPSKEEAKQADRVSAFCQNVVDTISQSALFKATRPLLKRIYEPVGKREAKQGRETVIGPDERTKLNELSEDIKVHDDILRCIDVASVGAMIACSGIFLASALLCVAIVGFSSGLLPILLPILLLGILSILIEVAVLIPLTVLFNYTCSHRNEKCREYDTIYNAYSLLL